LSNIGLALTNACIKWAVNSPFQAYIENRDISANLGRYCTCIYHQAWHLYWEWLSRLNSLCVCSILCKFW